MRQSTLNTNLVAILHAVSSQGKKEKIRERNEIAVGRGAGCHNEAGEDIVVVAEYSCAHCAREARAPRYVISSEPVAVKSRLLHLLRLNPVNQLHCDLQIHWLVPQVHLHGTRLPQLPHISGPPKNA
jgi:hypothetical protein